ELQLGDKARAEPIFSRKLTHFVQLTDCPRSYSSSDENVPHPSGLFQSPPLVVHSGHAPSPNRKLGQLLVPDDLMHESLNCFDDPRLSRHILGYLLLRPESLSSSATGRRASIIPDRYILRMAHATDTTLPLPAGNVACN